MDFERVVVTGKVTSLPTAIGSKSERIAVVIETEEGQRLVLQTPTGPSYGDLTLANLVGARITIKGFSNGNTLIIEDWKVAK